MTIAPAPQFSERPGNIYTRKVSPALTGQRGPLRFEEGVATDSDIPREFGIGAGQGYMPAPGRPNRNANVFEKTAEETMHERAHVGSAAWVESQNTLSDFSGAAFSDYASNVIEEVTRDGSHQQRMNPAVVQD